MDADHVLTALSVVFHHSSLFVMPFRIDSCCLCDGQLFTHFVVRLFFVPSVAPRSACAPDVSATIHAFSALWCTGIPATPGQFVVFTVPDHSFGRLTYYCLRFFRTGDNVDRYGHLRGCCLPVQFPRHCIFVNRLPLPYALPNAGRARSGRHSTASVFRSSSLCARISPTCSFAGRGRGFPTTCSAAVVGVITTRSPRRTISSELPFYALHSPNATPFILYGN